MTYRIIFTPYFKKAVKRLAKKYKSISRDLASIQNQLSENPTSGILITSNTYKIRMAIASKGKGKSGGARIIYYVVTNQNDIYLMYIYDKSELENLPDKQIKEMIEELIKEME